MKKRVIWLAVLALLAIFLISGTAFAEGEEPPAAPEEPAAPAETAPSPEAPEAPAEPAPVVEAAPPAAETQPEAPAEEQPAVEEIPAAEMAPVAEEAPVLESAPVVEEAPIAEEVPVVAEPLTTEPAIEPVVEVPPTEEILTAEEELPAAQEEIVLVDAQGEPLVLASEETAEMMENADPYFTVDTTKYCFVPLAGSCDASCDVCVKHASPIQGAIDYLDANYLVPTDGFIYVEKATYYGNVTINGVSTYLNSLAGLTNTTPGLFPTISGTLTLSNLTNGFELYGFNVTGGTRILDSSGEFNIENVSGTLTMEHVDASGLDDTVNLSPGDGITIKNHKGNIVLNQVTSNKRDSDGSGGGSGLFIDQDSGTVTIRDSQFNQNAVDGLRIISVGNVTISNLLNTETTVTANENGNTGMRIETPATVTLKNVIANNNVAYGIDVAYGSGSLTNINGAVAQDNGASGIFVSTRGSTLKNIAVNGNDENGLWVNIHSGTTLLENVVAICNGTYDCNGENPIDGTLDEFGVRIYAYSPTTGTVTLRNITTYNNEDGGIYSETFGAVIASNTSTNNSANGDGTYITTNGAVTITGLGAFDNDANGLYVRTKGAITISGINAGNNVLSGADLDNCLYSDSTELCAGSGAIQVKNTTGMLSDLSNNGHFGLWAVSKGAITVTNLNANENGSDGAFLWNYRGGSSAGVTVNTLGAVRNNFYHNGLDTDFNPWYPNGGEEYWVRWNGLTILSGGNIAVRNTDGHESENGGAGMVISNGTSLTPKTITLTSVNTNGNSSTGVIVWSKGNVTLNYVYGNGNDAGGIFVDTCLYDDVNDQCMGSGTVRLAYVDAYENDRLGIEVNAKGTITLLNTNSGSNGDTGINLINNYRLATAGVLLTNINADDNNNNGLVVLTNGSALLTNINTHNNAKREGWINDGEMVQDFFNGNNGPDRWWFEAANGTSYEIRLDADVADFFDYNNRVDFYPLIEIYDSEDWENPITIPVDSCNDIFCAFTFSQTSDPEPHNYFLLVGSTDNGTDFNGASGFYHLNINDSNQTDFPNQAYWVNGTGIEAGGSVTVRGINSSNNSLEGLGITVKGNLSNITLSNLQINDNGTEGVNLTCGQAPDYSASGFGTGSITISGSNNLNNNGWDGLMMATSGNVTLSNLEASRNGQNSGSSGISIRDDLAAKVVTLSNINAGENGLIGLDIFATGNITLTRVNVWNNFNEGGIFLDNCLLIGDYCTGTGSVRLTTVNSDNNQGKGIEIFSKGYIALLGVQANDNWQTGIRAINDFMGATAGITLATVRAENNGDSGITACTNGALLMSNLNANNNNMSWGGIDNGSTVQNYLNLNKDTDHWWFEAVEGDEITLTLWADGSADGGSSWLNRWDFDPFLKIFDSDGNEITDNQEIDDQYSSGNWFSDYYEIVWTPDTGQNGMYYLEVSSYNDASGFYRLSVGDDNPADPNMMWVEGLYFSAGGSVVLSGTNSFNDNEQTGLFGWSGGDVMLANVVAWNNGCEGIYIDNTAGSGKVTLSGANFSGNNGWEGLRVITDGAVSLNNLEAKNNGQDGIRIVANTDLKAVTLKNIVTMWNGLSGIEMEMDGGTNGITTLNNVRAWFNNKDGFVYWDLPDLLFINTNNIFLGNGDQQLYQE